MLTRTRKWLSVFVIAIVAIFLAACTTEKEPEKVTPTDIEISLDVYVGVKGVLIGGADMELSIITTPADAVDTVTWTSADPSVATVVDGKVTGLKGGKVKITAVSTEDNSVKDEVEIMVYESMDKIKVLMAAMNYVKQNVPTYVAADLTLPVYENKLVKVEYFDLEGSKLPGGVYDHDYVADVYENLNVKLTYEGEVLEFPIQFCVVNDLANNEFTAIEAAKVAVNEYLEFNKEFKVYQNIKLPATLSQLLEWTNAEYVAPAKDVAITWTSTNTGVLTSAGTYIRPNDDTELTLEAYFVCGGVSAVTRHKVVAKGYTQEEAVAYITANTLPKVTSIQAQNMTLPARDTKFNATITWASNNEAVLSSTGKMDPYLETETTVKLTATIKYPGTNGSQFAFEDTVELSILVKPAANDAQKVALDLSNKFADESFPHYFPYGLKDREGNTLPLPTTVGGEGTYKDVAITWTSSEADLFDANWVLLKQYLRYHPVTLTYSVTVEGATATGEVIINVGVTKVANVIYMGGNMYLRPANQPQPFDELDQISRDDAQSGTSYASTATGAYYAQGWTGATFYRDITQEDGSVLRYQFFVSNRYGVVIGENDTLTLDENGIIIGGLDTEFKTGYSNRQIVFVNTLDHDVKLPIAFNTLADYKKETGVTLNAMGQAISVSKWEGIVFGAAQPAVVIGGDGKVTETYGTKTFEVGLKEAADAAGLDFLRDYIILPAGGVAYTGRFARAAALDAILCDANAEYTIEVFTSKHLPA